MLLFFLIFLILHMPILLATESWNPMVVSAPIVNLRESPCPLPLGLKGPLLIDDLKCSNGKGHNTQLLINEDVLASDTPDFPEWCYVQVPGQPTFQHGQWVAYEGFVQKEQLTEQPHNRLPLTHALTKAVIPLYEQPVSTAKKITTLSLGSLIYAEYYNSKWMQVVLPNGKKGFVESHNAQSLEEAKKLRSDEVRKRIVDLALEFLGSPYVWGGNSGYNPDTPDGEITGFDCSGFLYLLYRIYGMHLPRDARGQYYTSNKLKKGTQLLPGDFIFHGWVPDPKKISHVRMYIGKLAIHAQEEQDYVIEVHGAGGSSVNEVSSKDNLTTKLTPLSDILPIPLQQFSCDDAHYFYNGRYFFIGSPFS